MCEYRTNTNVFCCNQAKERLIAVREILCPEDWLRFETPIGCGIWDNIICHGGFGIHSSRLARFVSNDVVSNTCVATIVKNAADTWIVCACDGLVFPKRFGSNGDENRIKVKTMLDTTYLGHRSIMGTHLQTDMEILQDWCLAQSKVRNPFWVLLPFGELYSSCNM